MMIDIHFVKSMLRVSIISIGRFDMQIYLAICEAFYFSTTSGIPRLVESTQGLP